MVVWGSPAHVPFSWSQLSSVLQLPRNCWSVLSRVAPEENSLISYKEMQAKATPLQGGSDEVTEAHQRKSIFSYAAPMQDQFSLQLPPWRFQWDALKFISINSWVGRCFLLPRFVLLLHPLHSFSDFRLWGLSSTWLILPWGCFLAGFGAKGGLKQPQRAVRGCCCSSLVGGSVLLLSSV